jgi:hypothetical protein
MAEMSKTWGWGGRCLRSVHSLAKEWNVDANDLDAIGSVPKDD